MSYQKEMKRIYPGWKPRDPNTIKADFTKEPSFWFLQEDAACFKKGSIMNEDVNELAVYADAMEKMAAEKPEDTKEEVKEEVKPEENGKVPF